MIPFEKITPISEKEKTKVWLASAEGYKEPVIVKELSNANANLLERISKIENPHIPHIIFIDTSENVTTVMEEYIDGLAFDQYIKEKELKETEIVALLLQICDGIKTLHNQNPPIIHRDIKPSNLLVTSDGTVKIIDFDASREYKEEATADTRYLGTAEYAPPEQYGYSQTDARSDIYSLGAVMYEIFFGKQLPKITSKNSLDIETMYQSRQKIHPELIRIIEKCTMFNPVARYKTIEELEQALKHYTHAGNKRLLARCTAAIAAVALVGGIVVLGQHLNRKPATFEQKTVPTATPYAGEVKEYTIDCFNVRTNTSQTFTYYYMQNQPELTPIHIVSGLLNTYKIQKVYIQELKQHKKEEIDSKYWSSDENNYVTISDEYLSTLKTDYTYEIILDCGEAIIVCQLTIIDNLDKVAFPFTQFIFTPGNTEYLHDHPGDIVLAATHSFGRKITKIVDLDAKKEVDKKYYEIDDKNGYLTVKQSLFDKVPGGSYINWRFYYTSIDGFDDNNYHDYSFTVRDRAYIAPKIKKSSFICSSEHLEDIVFELEWNDAKGKLQGIYPMENDLPEPSKKEYTITDSSIILKKEFLKKLSIGTHSYCFEFGDVAMGFSITIK